MFEKVVSPNQIAQTAQLAQEIWTQYYTPFLPKGQVPYMLQKFQSASAIATQIKTGHNYFLLRLNGSNPDRVWNPVRVNDVVEKEPIGYLDFYQKDDLVFISKIYIKAQFRGSGIGAAALAFIRESAKKIGAKKLQLTVNKYNTGAIKAYEKNGFKNVEALVIDIGNGFVMDDFVFEKLIIE